MAAASRKETPLLSPAMKAGLMRGVRRLAGVALIGGGGVLLAAATTYAPSDPSLNMATSGDAANLMGRFGAIVADAMLQSAGLASLAAPLVLLVWGMRWTATARIGWMWLRMLAAVAAVLLLAAAAAYFGNPSWWPLQSGLGGAFGNVMRGGLTRLTDGRIVAALIAAPAAAILGTLTLGWAAAVKTSELRTFARLAAAFAVAVVSLIFGIGRSIGRLGRKGLAFLSSAREKTLPPAAAANRRQEPVLSASFRQTAAPKTESSRNVEAAVAVGRNDPAAEASFAAETPQIVVTVPPLRPEAAATRRDDGKRQGALPLQDASGTMQTPPLDLLSPAKAPAGSSFNEDALTQNARLLETVLSDFGVDGTIVHVRPGPVVTLYELDPAPGTKTSRVVSLADDIARSMSAVSVRIAVAPGKSTIGIELPNAQRETVNFRDLLAADDFERHGGGLTLALGRDIGGAPVYVDLARMPHLLIAGTTGSGKSVAVNTMICSLLYRLTPQQCRFIMVDPKMLELSAYDGIPHLLTPVVTDPGKAVVALKWAVKEMETRYRSMSRMGVRNIAGYNQKLAEAAAEGKELTRMVQVAFDPETGKPVFEEQRFDMTPLPFIVVIVDEMADLMLVAGKDVEAAIQRLAQMARAAGIHLVMATQRPSVDVVTGTIKANFPTRISFQVTSKIDSRTILGEQGAEQLLGQGDMLYMAAGGRIVRVHGPFVADAEVEAIAGFLRAQAEPDYIESIVDEEEQGPSAMLDLLSEGESNGDNGLFDQAVALVARERKASTSFIQRHLQIGYNRAARLIERMEKEGMVSRANHVGKREVLLPPAPDFN